MPARASRPTRRGVTTVGARPCVRASVITWTRTFWVVDLIFLSIFIIEICLRLYAWGLTYLKDILNFVDMLIVGISFVMCVAALGARGA